MKKSVILLMIAMLYFGCSASKNETNAYQAQKHENIIKSKSFEIKCDWAQPQMTGAMYQIQNSGLLPVGSTVGNIDILSNTNYFRMTEDTVAAYLPYFGEQRIGGSYANNAIAVAFEGIPEDLTLLKGKKGSYSIKFSIKSKYKSSESYTVYIKIFRNLSSTIYINSSHRTSIEYNGYVKALDAVVDESI